MRSFATICAALFLSASSAHAGSGYWKADQYWEVNQASSDADCILTSVPMLRGDVSYVVAMSVGRSNWVALVTDSNVSTTQAAIEFHGGGGFDFYEIQQTQNSNPYVIQAEISSAMMARLIAGMREASGAMFVAGGQGFFLPPVPFEAAYQTLRRCEQRRLGAVLPD